MTHVRIIGATFGADRDAERAYARLLEMGFPEAAVRRHIDPHSGALRLLEVRVSEQGAATVITALTYENALDLHEDSTEWPSQRWFSRQNTINTGDGTLPGQGDSEAGDPS